jgi:hypothetical protein
MNPTTREAVPAPWTEVAVQTTGEGVDVHFWGRVYRFRNAALPTGIATAGQEVLAEPIRLVGVADGKPIAWDRMGALLLRQDSTKATVCGWQASASLIADAVSQIEFDGMMRVDLAVTAQRGASPKVEALWLEVPLRAERASLFHYWPGDWGSAANSGAIGEAGLALPFKAFVWVGWEEGGLGWFAESDKGWQPAEAGRCVEVVRQDRQALLRLRLLDSPPPALPLTFTFGFQATPVKPLMKDPRKDRLLYGADYGLEEQPAKTAAGEKALDQMKAAGIKTLIIHEHWTPIQNYWETTHEARLNRIVSECHRRDMKLILYFGYELSMLAPEWGKLADDVLVKDPSNRLSGGYQRQPDQRDYVVCYRSEWRDRLVDGIAWAMDRYGFDGVYLDGTIEPFACANQRHGCGYTAADGARKVTYPIFAVRDLMKRLYALVHARDGWIVAHQSTCCLTPTLAFCDCYLDGEHLQPNYTPAIQNLLDKQASGILEVLPLATFRAEFMGWNYGVPCEFLVYQRPPNWTLEHALSFTLLHNVLPYTVGYGADFDLVTQVWRALTDFGAWEATWHPYWRNQELVEARPAGVKVSLYQRGNRLLLVVANLSSQEVKDARIRPSRQALGLPDPLPVASDAISGERLDAEGDSVRLSLPPMKVKLIRIG